MLTTLNSSSSKNRRFLQIIRSNLLEAILKLVCFFFFFSVLLIAITGILLYLFFMVNKDVADPRCVVSLRALVVFAHAHDLIGFLVEKNIVLARIGFDWIVGG